MTKSKASPAQSVARKVRASATLLVRLKPYDKRRRHVMRVYVHGPSSKKFEERKGWYKVDSELAEYLAEIPQIEGDEDAPRAFDVATPAEAAKIDERERKVRERRALAAEANDLSSGDLGGRRRAIDATDAPVADRHVARRSAQPAARPRSMRADA
jgi:hypothetical protein